MTEPTEFAHRAELEELARKNSADEVNRAEVRNPAVLAERVRSSVTFAENDATPPAERQMRLEALRKAIVDISRRENRSEAELYALIWPAQTKQLQEMRFWTVLQDIRDLRRSVHPLVLHQHLQVLAQRTPESFLANHFEELRSLPNADDFFSIAAAAATRLRSVPRLGPAAIRYFGSKLYAQELLLKLTEDESNCIFLIGNFDAYRSQGNGLAVFRAAVEKIQTEGRPDSMGMRNIAEQAQGDTEVMRMIFEAFSAQNPSLVLQFFSETANPELRSYLEPAVRATLLLQPRYALQYFSAYRTEPYAREILTMVASRIPQEFLLAFSSLPDNSQYSDIQQTAERFLKRVSVLRSTSMNAEERAKSIRDFLREASPYAELGLERFSKETGISLRCAGMRTDTLSFVFMNTFSGRNTLPVALSMTFAELQTVGSEEQMMQLCMRKYGSIRRERRQTSPVQRRASSLPEEELPSVTRPRPEPAFQMGEQMDIWVRDYQFDLPADGNTTVMTAIAPGDLRGTEQDFARTIGDIYQRRYGASVTAVHVEHPKVWTEQSRNLRNLPAARDTSRESVMTSLASSLQQAVESGQGMFLFHYMAHGGGIDERSGRGGSYGTITLADGQMDVEQIAQILARNVNGRPLCAQIDITIIAESCYGGAQLERIVQYLQTRNIPVKNLRIIAESNLTTSAGDFLLSNASITNENRRNQSGGGAFSYYLDYYFQMIDTMRVRGEQVRQPVGTFGHAIQFADLMARQDTRNQNLQALHYSTEHLINTYFSRTNDAQNTNMRSA